MPAATNDQLVARWKDRSAPLLPLLHEFQERDGYLSEEALRAVSAGLNIPIAELFGTVTFYHHFARDARQGARPRVCDGPACRLAGAEELMEELRADGRDPASMPCPGRCDAPIPVILGGAVLTGRPGGALRSVAAPLPPDPPPGAEECVFAGIRAPGRAGLAAYRAQGGYQALARTLAETTPEQLIGQIDDSGLAGRGGAGFPTGRKWRAVLEAPGTPKTVVCNADEGEPGCFKDRVLMDRDPHALIEGMALAGYATGAERGFVYLRYEYPGTAGVLATAIAEAEGAGLLGRNVLGSAFSFRVLVRRGAGAYICGEETSLLNSLEGRHPFPRNRPPFPVERGYEDLPTAVNNVETLATVPPIVTRGPGWYRSLGRGTHAGTKIMSVSGDVRRPGNYEVPIGLPLAELLHDWCGGPPPGREFQAATMAGLSGGFLGTRDFDATLDEPSLRARGSFLGAGGVVVFDDSRDMVDATRNAMAFFADESCGKCFPCRIGAQRLVERLDGQGPAAFGEWAAEVADLGKTMKETSACGLGQAAPLLTESLLRYFPDGVRERLEDEWTKHGPAGTARPGPPRRRCRLGA